MHHYAAAAVGTDKRARQKANRAARIEEVQRVDRRSRVTRTAIRIGVIVAGGRRRGSSSTACSRATTATTTTATSSTTSADSSDAGSTTTGPADGQQRRHRQDGPTSTAAGQEAVEPVCPAEDGSSPRQTQFTAAPPTCIDPAATYLATFDTSAGTFTAEIDPALDEASANNFVFLARHHAYDGTIFHRVIDGFVVQGGDVQGLDGQGGPGYVFTGGTPETTPYELGALAMANPTVRRRTGRSSSWSPGRTAQALPANYSLFGQVTEGLDVLVQMQTVADRRGRQAGRGHRPQLGDDHRGAGSVVTPAWSEVPASS